MIWEMAILFSRTRRPCILNKTLILPALLVVSEIMLNSSMTLFLKSSISQPLVHQPLLKYHGASFV